MAEERNVGLARATDTSLTETDRIADDDADESKEELQRRMEEARESITQTVSEIKETVATQYHNVRESISDSLDWREQYRRRPVAFSVGALSVGLLVGYGVRGMFAGGDSEGIPAGYEEYDYDTDEGIAYSRSAPTPSYAGQAITGGGSSRAASPSREPSSYAPALMSMSDATLDETAEEDKGPGMFERFKGTQAYDRLTQEISTLGGRAVDELSHTAQTVVLPAILNKLKDAIGLDLSMEKRQAERSRVEREASSAHAEAVESGAKQQEAHEQAREQQQS